MKNRYYRTLAAAVGSVIALLLPAVSTAQGRGAALSRDPTGVWALWRGRFDNEQWTRLRIERDGDSLRAWAPSGLRLTGAFVGDRLAMRSTAVEGRPAELLEARWQGDSLVGTSVEGARTWTIRLLRELVRPAVAPTRQVFTPLQFSSAFSSTVAPVLRIWPGDTVRTETGGKNAIYAFGNALTGPFSIEGAMPGDVIAVHLLRIHTNRDSAVSGTDLNWRAVQPWYFLGNTEAGSGADGKWILDTIAGVARLENPSEGLRSFTIPLRAMLGCVGVAPGRGESHHGGELGYWGGNMDYNRVVEGSTVYLQVYQPGAMLFLGDGHAAQGDGELAGQGLETSMDIEFSVELIREKQIGFPRIEDAQHIMAVGIGGSIDDALRSATTGLARWLESEYKLTRTEVALVLGSAATYDVAEVVDGGTYNVVARLSKATLRGVTIRPTGGTP